MAPDEPVTDDMKGSVAVTVQLPSVFRVTENVPTPFVRPPSGARTAAESVLEKLTVPE